MSLQFSDQSLAKLGGMSGTDSSLPQWTGRGAGLGQRSMCRTGGGWKWVSIPWMVLWISVALELCANDASGQGCLGEIRFFSGKEIGQIRANRMDAISGIGASRKNPGVLWVHNDEGIDRIFAIDTNGRPAGTFTLPQKLLDAEDIAVGPGPVAGVQYLYVADIGDERKQRNSLTVVRIPEPEVKLDSDDQQTQPFSNSAYLILTFPPGDRPNCEALLIDPLSGDLLLVTREPNFGRVFLATPGQLAQGGAPLALMGEVPLAEVTAGDISPDGALIALRSGDTAMVWTRQPGESVVQALARKSQLIPLATEEAQGESLAFDPSGSGYYTTSEGDDQPIFYFKRNTTGFDSAICLGVASAPELTEVSGVVASRRHPGVVWLHNDGPRNRLFALRTNGTLLGTFSLSRALLDFEDIAMGPGSDPAKDYIYAGDIGDNAAERDSIQILRIPEPTITSASSVAAVDLAVESAISLKYPDGAHDAEALMVDPLTGDVFIATKESQGFGLYQASRLDLASGRTVVLKWVHTGTFEQVSGGDISPDGRRIVLRREDAACLWERSPGQTVEQAFRQPGKEIPVVGPPEEPNGEGISFEADGTGYFTISEGMNPAVFLFVPLAVARFEGGPVLTRNGWRLSIRGCDGVTVGIEGSSDLLKWEFVGEATVAAGVAALTDPAFDEQRFYRLNTRPAAFR